MNIKHLTLVLLVLFSNLFSACKKDKNSSEYSEVNQFIYDNMSVYYLWNDEMPDLDPSKQGDPENYFDTLLYDSIDQWSYITDDAEELASYLDGEVKEVGYSLSFYYAYSSGSEEIVAFIEYVEPGGPAEEAGLKRGDMIVQINGEILTTSNYTGLVYDESLTVGLGVYVDGTIENLSPSYSLEAEELQIDPILTTNIFEKDDVKVGYLCYTSFLSSYNDELESVFANFKSQGIEDLILDLRYNGGGSVNTALLMAEMIGPSTLAGNVFIRYAYNDVITAAYEEAYPDEEDLFESYFDENANNLNLSRLYVLTTSGTASASEMVMYSLMPYMDVIQIGEQTVGKYYASTTFTDDDSSWAIQPLILRAENNDNSIDYSQGLIPDKQESDDLTYELGSEKDVLTAIALDQIWGTSISSLSMKNAITMPVNKLTSLKGSKGELRNNMYVDLQKR